MRTETYSLSITLGSVGTAFPARDLTGITVEVTGTFTGTVKLVGRVGTGAPWTTLSTCTAPGLLTTTATIMQIAIDTTGVTGSPAATLAANSLRAD